MSRLPLLALVAALVFFGFGLTGVFVEKTTSDDGALVISGSILIAALILRRS